MKAFVQHKDPNGDKAVLQSLVRFTDLRDSVIFTSKTNLNKKLEDKKKVTEESLSYYQRRIDLTRIGDIENFIINSILDEKDGIILATLFPSSMILAVDDDENDVIIDKDGICDVIFSQNVFIVDGQHRMLAMIRVYDKIDKNNELSQDDKAYIKKYIENYKFNCTILVNYDLWEQGQVFINVNFKQKPVNKSLYYEIFGSEYRENKTDWRRNKIYLAHCLAKVLNENRESPFRGKIKMLGTGVGYISQAFVVEALLPHLSSNGIWYIDTNKENLSSVDYSYFSTELVSYFNTIHRLFESYWPEENATKGTLICKTTGFGALSKLMGTIRDADDESIVKALKRSSSAKELCKDYISIVEKKLQPLVNCADTLFGINSEFAQNTGRAAESKLYKRMLSELQKRSSSVSGLSESDLATIYEQIQNFLWVNSIEDFDELVHHYDVEDITDFDLSSLVRTIGGYDIICSFGINVNLYMDNDDITGFKMNFPAIIKASYDTDNKLLDDSVLLTIDTRKYYE